MPRLFCPLPLVSGARVQLPAQAARHAQVLRLQPGDTVTLFNGEGGEFAAVIEQMGRSDVTVQVGLHTATEREAARGVHVVLGIPANERMDWLVEKAAELGAASIQPLLTERSVLRLAGERADKRRSHWQAIAVAACEQCGRNRLPTVHPLQTFAHWARAMTAPPLPGLRLLLSLQPQARPLSETLASDAANGGRVTLLSGPEGGLSAAEEALALGLGFVPVTLGPRILRAETAPLAALLLACDQGWPRHAGRV
ncbi:MAG: 16S rRNA (uracil(1498)-N(3))-methyltransferase [Burkholderiaceae bacterium]